MTEQAQYLFAPPTQGDWLSFAAVFVALALLVFRGETLRKRFNWPPETTRKAVFVGLGVLASFTPRIFTTALPPLLVAVFFVVVNAFMLRSQLMSATREPERVSYESVLFPVAYSILVLLFWTREPVILIMSMLVLAFGASAAALAGHNNKTATVFWINSEKKSLEGSLAMFAVSCATLFAGIHHFGINLNPKLDYAVGVALCGALTVTAWEALSSRGFGTLTIPLSVAFVLACFIFPSYVNHKQLSIGAALGVFVGVASYYTRLLAASGAVATFILSSLLYGIGGWKWTVPIVAFFLLSSLLSRVGRRKKSALEDMFEKTGTRDYAQVFANGGVAGILVVLSYFFRDIDFYSLYLGSVAAATADTWATEIGLLARQEPLLITTFKRVSRGVNGGVTLVGLIAGAVGAAVIGLSAQAWTSGADFMMKIVIAGVVGGLVDSLFGATVQAQYRCEVCQTATERTSHHDTPTTLVRGYRRINNDTVNWICAATGALTMVVLNKI